MLSLFLHLGLAEVLGFRDETISGYADREAVFHLVEFEGDAFAGQITIQFPEKGQVVGMGPCNRYFGEQTVPLPWIEIGALASTKRACPDLDVEQRYFAALGRMHLAEVAGGVLILSNDDGEELVFRVHP